MRTTSDLPHALMREPNAHAALTVGKLKDYFANSVQAALQRPAFNGVQPTRSLAPVFKRSGAKAMPAVSNSGLNASRDNKDNS